VNSNDHIRKLYLRYLDESITLPEQEILFNFFASATETAIENVIGEYLENGEVPNDLSFLDANTIKIFEKIKDSVGMAPAQEPTVKPKIPIYNTVLFKTAAILTIVLGIVAYLLMYNKPIVILTVSAPYGTIKQFTLPDSSKVWLNAGTAIEYPERFSGDTRQITLKNGQAFFDIKHDKNHPFIVKATDIDVTVLGTSFEVKSFAEEQEARISVLTGKVGVSDTDQKTITEFVTSNQQINFKRKTRQYSKSEISSDQIASWRSRRMTFEKEPFPYIVSALERNYNVKIKIENPKLLGQKVTLSLDNQPLEEVLNILSYSVNFTFKIENDKQISIK